MFTDTFIYAVQLRDVRRALQAMWRQLKGKVTGQPPEGPSRTVSRISHTASTRVSLGSPALRRYGLLAFGYMCCKAAWLVVLFVVLCVLRSCVVLSSPSIVNGIKVFVFCDLLQYNDNKKCSTSYHLVKCEQKQPFSKIVWPPPENIIVSPI